MPDPITAIPASTAGPEFSVPGLDGTAPAPTAPARGGGFGAALVEQLDRLEETQQSAAGQAQALASGTADDVTSVVMEVERAQLALQLASQMRNTAVEAYHEIFRTQV